MVDVGEDVVSEASKGINKTCKSGVGRGFAAPGERGRL